MSPNPSELSDPARALHRHVRHLHGLILISMAALLLLSCGINIFLFKQMRVARTQVGASRILVQSLSDQYQRKEPAMRRFVSALQAFGASHPDFQPILVPYRGALPQFFTGPILPTTNRFVTPGP